MADDDRTFSPTEAEANRAARQGLGVGQREMDLQADPGEHLPPDVVADAAEAEDEADDAADEDRRALKVGQGSKTRQHTKDIISRRV